jgi:hypothetical protein
MSFAAELAFDDLEAVRLQQLLSARGERFVGVSDRLQLNFLSADSDRLSQVSCVHAGSNLRCDFEFPETAAAGLLGLLSSESGIQLNFAWSHLQLAPPTSAPVARIRLTFSRRLNPPVAILSGGQLRNQGSGAVTVYYVYEPNGDLRLLDPPLRIRPGEAAAVDTPAVSRLARSGIAVDLPNLLDLQRHFLIADSSSVVDRVTVRNALPRLIEELGGHFLKMEITVSYLTYEGGGLRELSTSSSSLSASGLPGAEVEIPFVRNSARRVRVSGTAYFENGKADLRPLVSEDLTFIITRSMLP